MAIQRLDPGGYDVSNSTTTLLNAKFNDDNNLVGVTNSATAGRSNQNAYTTSVSGSYLGWWFTSGWQETIHGFAYYNPNTTFTNNNRVCNAQDGATTQVDIRTDGSGHLFATRNGTAIGSASANALAVGWYYIEVKYHIASGTSGSVEVRVTPLGGAASVWLSVTGVNTQATANASANRFYVISRGAVGPQLWKDIYILDAGTGINTTYLGDMTVKVLYSASADGTFQQWAPNTGTQVAAVQDGNTHAGSWPDGDTTFISDTVAGDISAFAMDSTSAAVIFGVEHVTYARTASTGTINQVLVQSGSVVETGATITLTTSYVYYRDIQEQNPAGPATWTAATINGTHPGVKIQATSASARVSQELLLVAYSNVTAPPDEDFWRNAVAPVVASNYLASRPSLDPEEIPAGTLFLRGPLDEDFWLNPVAPVASLNYVRRPFEDREEVLVRTPHGWFWVIT